MPDARQSFETPIARPDLGLVPAVGDPRSVGWIRLNTNELPLTPPASVVDSVQRATYDVNRYPNPDGEPLRGALASFHRLSKQQVLVAAGADALLDLCFRAYCSPGSAVFTLAVTYPHIHNLARIHSASLYLATSPEELLSGSSGPRSLTFLANPNSPTGAWITPAEIAELTQCSGLVVVDEAYVAFAPQSATEVLTKLPNFVVIRTFSKSHGLAGARVGYAVGQPAVVRALSAVRDPYPVGTGSIAAGVAALGEASYYEAAALKTIAERERLADAIRSLGWEVPQSHGNFIFARPPSGEALPYVSLLERRRILVRFFPSDPGAMRISIGAADEHDRLIEALADAGVVDVPAID